MDKNNIILYANGSGGNHGCEAISRSLIKIFHKLSHKYILSKNPEEDAKYGLTEISEIISIAGNKSIDLDYLKCLIRLKIGHNRYAMDFYPYVKAIKSIKNWSNSVALSVGGDNYCYGGADYFGELDNVFHKKNITTALVGCSIEPDVITPDIVKALKNHKAIIARESITYISLRDAGLTNVHLIPDPAFLLDSAEMPLPKEFAVGNTVGLNISPLVEELSSGDNIVYRNTEKLIEHILKLTDMNICMIPHVVWAHSNDFKILTPLYKKYRTTGRISLIADSSAEVLKGYISRCRFMIAARTHASIAAYSTGVPTFVLGYSVKSRGIARDIFGEETGFVKPTKHFENEDELINAFIFLRENEEDIKDKLNKYNTNQVAQLYKLPSLILQ